MSGERILIVDDIDTNLEVLQRRLERQGYQVFAAYHGQEALDVLQNQMVDLIISDILMPVMDGYDLCRHCQKDERLKHIPFLFYTATYTDDKDHRLGLSLGARMFIIKPQPRRDLLRLIEQALGHKASIEPSKPSPAALSYIAEKEYTELHGERVGAKLEQKIEQLERANRLLQKQLNEDDKLRTVLSESEAHYRILSDASPVGVYLIQDGLLQYVNQCLIDVTGYTADEMIGKMTPLDLVTEASRPLMIEQMRKRLAGEQALAHYSCQGLTKSGELIDFEVHGAVVMHQGRPALTGTLLDVTARKRAESELEEYRNHLEEQVEQRTAELAKANEHLQELDKLKSMFIASMSHELRTPMNSILGFTDLILQGMTGDINDIQRDQLTRVNRSGRHLLALITDVIDLSKVEAGKVAAIPTDFALPALLSEVIQDIQFEAEKKAMVIHLQLDEVMDIFTDRQRLMQCLLNILSNAVKYSKQGDIVVTATKQGQELVIDIQDHGIGMSEEQVSLLFKPFVRLDSELTVKAGGTGLGLYLTQKLMQEVLDGSISVRSQSGIGSCFTLRLPCHLKPKKTNLNRGEK